jgi:hypothetical protein
VQKSSTWCKNRPLVQKSSTFKLFKSRATSADAEKHPSKKIRKLFGVTVSRAQSGAERRFLARKFQT